MARPASARGARKHSPRVEPEARTSGAFVARNGGGARTPRAHVHTPTDGRTSLRRAAPLLSVAARLASARAATRAATLAVWPARCST
jgi:hypothetical protein